MTATRRLLTDVLANGVIQCLVVLGTLATFVLLARYSNAEDYGQLQFLFACGAVGAALCRPWSNITLTKALITHNAELAISDAKRTVFWAACIFSLAAACGLLLNITGHERMTEASLAVGLFAVVAALEKSDAALQGLRRSRLARCLALCQVLISLALVPVCILTGTSMWTIGCLFATVRCACALAGWVIVCRTLPYGPATVPSESLTQEGRRNAANISTTEGLAQADRLILGHISPADCAHYSIAVQLPRRIADSAKAALWSLCGELGARTRTDANALLRRIVPGLLLLGATVATALSLAAEPIILTLYGDKYAPSIYLLHWTPILVIGAMANQVLQWHSLYQEDGAWARRTRLIKQFIFTALLIILTPRMLAIGALFALLAAEIAQMVCWIPYYYSRAHLNRPTSPDNIH